MISGSTPGPCSLLWNLVHGCVGWSLSERSFGMDAWVPEWMRGFESFGWSFGTVFRNGCVGSSLSEQSFGMDAWVPEWMRGLKVFRSKVFRKYQKWMRRWMVGSLVFRNGLSECGWSGSKWMVGSLVFRNSLSECGRPRPQPRRGGIAGGVLNSWSEVKWGGLAGSCGRAGGGLGRGRRRSFGHSVFPSGEDRGDAQSTLLSQTGEQSVLSETTESASLSRARSVANRRARAVEKGNESALSETSQQSAFCRKPPRERCGKPLSRARSAERKPLSTRSVANREQSALLCPLQAWRQHSYM